MSSVRNALRTLEAHCRKACSIGHALPPVLGRGRRKWLCALPLVPVLSIVALGQGAAARQVSVQPGAVAAQSGAVAVEASAAGNPYAEFLSRMAAGLPAPAAVPASGGENQVAEMGRDVELRVWAALDERSHLDESQRMRLLEQSVATINALCARLDVPGTRGDPNMGRFLLAPLLASIHRIETAQAVPQAQIDAWLKALRSAVDYQYQQYGKATSANWDTRLAGGYPNMDAGYVAVMGLAGRLYGEAKFEESAERFIGLIRQNVQSGGSVLYVGSNHGEGLDINAAPVYTGVVVRFIGQYLALTGSPAARELLESLEPHYPRSWVAPGIPENSTAPWWKHTNYVNRLVVAGLPEIVASVAQSPSNRYLAEQLLAIGRTDRDSALVAVDFYEPTLASQPQERNRVVTDADIEGFRGFFGDFSWVGALGPTQDTLVGALATVPTGLGADANRPFNYYSLLLVTPEVGLAGHPEPRTPLYVHAAFATGQEYPGSSAVSVEDSLGVLGASYRLRQPAIFRPENPETQWQVGQVWFFLDRYVIGRVGMQFQGRERDNTYARMRIRTEHRGSLARTGDGRYAVGPLRLQVLSSFPVMTQGVAEITDHRTDTPNADEIFLAEAGTQAFASRPKGYQTLLCLSYGDAPEPTAVQVLDADTLSGFELLADGKHYTVLFNYSEQAVRWQVPAVEGGQTARLLAGSGKATQLQVVDVDAGGHIEVAPYGVLCVIRQP